MPQNPPVRPRTALAQRYMFQPSQNALNVPVKERSHGPACRRRLARQMVGYYPEALRDAIEPVNQRIYDTVNNGVCKAGFATSQDAYAAAIDPLFDNLDWLEDRLGDRRYLMGNQITEADWRLFTTLVRFDLVYSIARIQVQPCADQARP